MSQLLYYKKRIIERINLYKLKRFNLISGDVDFFFIISAGRSGSTILRKHLMENAVIGIPPESEDLIPRLVNLFVTKRKNYEEFVNEAVHLLSKMNCIQPWELNLSELKVALLNLGKENRKIDIIIHLIFFKGVKNASENCLIGDKTPLLNDYLRLISVVFPKGKLIYIVRDGRAVVNSYVQSRNYTLEKAINRWKSSLTNFERFRKFFNKRVLLLRYEDFVTNTHFELMSILKFLDKPLQESKVNFEDLGDTTLSHHNNVQNPVNIDSIEKWKQELNEIDLEKIDKSILKELIKYNYKR